MEDVNGYSNYVVCVCVFLLFINHIPFLICVSIHFKSNCASIHLRVHIPDFVLFYILMHIF